MLLLKTKLIKDLDPNIKSSWNDSLFITFDIDWAHDSVIDYCHDYFSKRNLKTTWYTTHFSSKVQELSCDSNIEIGIHPNFNDLLYSDKAVLDSVGIINDLLDLFPESSTVRSHSLTMSERLLETFASLKLFRISNLFLPFDRFSKASPFNLWHDTVMIPHCYQDNISLKMSHDLVELDTNTSGLKVLLIHPIHFFLNTPSLEYYESCRPYFKDPKKLKEKRFKGNGIFSRVDLFLKYLYE